ncbi:MAG TPA: ADP-ribosylglycohydrolase family protein [Candidatus Limnocylindria bacterium]|nr:ADP-ribosylglycohydrolase family protein [Candidatus Limnocylindria bacterium]
MRVTWVQPEDVLRHELIQSAVEGKPIERVAARWAAAGGRLGAPERGTSPEAATAAQRRLARSLIDELDAIPSPKTADEPTEFEAIRESWSAPPPLPSVSRAALADRIRGAWLGRAVGCLLGKPVEGVGRAGIREILQATGRWPLADWFTARGLPEAVAARHPWNRASRTTSLAENIAGMPEDDDLNYTMLALALVEERGHAFTTDDVAERWLRELPGLRVFTAERAVYRNLLDGIDPIDAATVRNPYREWIGAQIRTDLYGWVCAGDPHAAAELAWRDARLSHVRSGAYGALFVAAMAAAACVANDVESVIAAGRSVVPPRSRLARSIELGLGLGRRAVPYEEAVDQLYAAHEGLHWVHALNNTAVVALALAESGRDFSRAICAAVSAGWDTDSNGATVGGIVGALAGASALPDRWTRPLGGRVASSLRGFDGATFDALAARTFALVGRT